MNTIESVQQKSLKELSIEHLNAAIKRLGENTRLANIATVTKDKNALLRLGMEKQSLEIEIAYHRHNIENDF